MAQQTSGSPGSAPAERGADPQATGRDLGGLERTLLALVTGTTHVVALVERDGTIAYASPSVLLHLGHRSDEIVGRAFDEILHPDDLGSALSMMAADLAQSGTPGSFAPDADIAAEYRLRHSDGRWIPFEVLRNNFLADPDIRGTLVIARPVGPRHALDQALSVLACGPDGGDALHRLAEYLDHRLPGTASAFVVAGDPPEWITGPAPTMWWGGRGPWDQAMSRREPQYSAVEESPTLDPSVKAAARDGGYRACWAIPLPIRHPRVYNVGSATDLAEELHRRAAADEVSGCLVVWACHDVLPPAGYLGVLERVGGMADLAIRRRRERQHLRRMVDFDHVTGALSRAGLESMIAGSETQPRARLLIDLDDFKYVNDRYGHAIGDEVLRTAVKRLTSTLRYQDLLCRLGGDEFLLLMAGGEAGPATAVASRIAAVLDSPITVGATSVQVKASIGIAAWDPEVPAAVLMERADQAMYRAKRNGKNAWALWGDE